MAINFVSNLPIHSNGLVDKATAAKAETLPIKGLPNKAGAESAQVDLTADLLDLGGQPPMDLEKIERLRNEIAKGEYQPDLNRIANAILESDELVLA